MITQRLKVEKDQAGNPTGNIIKDDGSLFTAFGHNYDNPRSQIIEDSWNKELYAGGFKGANHIANVSNYRQVDAGIINFGGLLVQTYEVTLTTDGNHNFAPNDKIVLSNVNGTYEKAQAFDINGYIADANTPRITSVSSDNLTIKYTIGWPVGSVPSDIPALNNVTTSVTGLIVAPSTIESDLAILNLNKSNIIRICLQLDKFMTDKNTPNQDQLNKLYEFCDLAAKYDIYVIINGANTWVAANQPDWLIGITEEDRWLTQANFWKAIASKIGGHPAVAWYSLINEPIDQYDDAVISAYSSASGIEIHVTQTDDGTFDSYSVFAGRVGKPGYALMSNGSGIELIQYQDLQVASDPLNTDVDTVFVANLIGITRSAYGSNPTINDANVVGSYISLIDKKPDVTNLQITNIDAVQSTALIDLAPSNSFQPFQIQTNQYQNKFGFVGSDYAAATKAASSVNWGGDDLLGANIPVGASNKTNRYSTQLSLAVGLTEVNHAISGSVLSSNINVFGVPFGYGQVLNARGQGASSDYANGNTFKINSVNFGTNDFLSYGTPYGYNTQFFINSLRTILSRLRSNAVNEFTGLSGFSTVSLNSASGGDYQQYSGGGTKTVTFSTGSGFIGGTIAIGFMVENNANVQAKIAVNSKSYNQSLISGIDTRPGITAPVVKRIPNLPAGANNITITFTVTSGNACLDYWQIESSNPAPIIVHNIAELQVAPITISSAPTASGYTYTYTTSTNHNLFIGESVNISGIAAGTNYNSFNGTFTVVDTPSLNQFTVTGSTLNPTATAISSAQVIANYQVSAIRNWNQEIANLVSTEFFDGTVFYFDVNDSSVLNTGSYVNSPITSPNPNISSDYLNPNDTGHAKISAGCKNLLNINGFGAVNGVSVTGTSYTYTTVIEHGLNVGDLVVIKNATPSTCNGAFTVNAITTKTFTVSGIANPVGLSAAGASYAQCLVQPNTTYFISTTNSSNIPSSSRVGFTTASIAGETNFFGQSKVDSNLRYQIILSNTNQVKTTFSSENCLIVDNTQWLRSPYNGTDRHYSPYLTLTPKSRNKFTIARQWINQIKSAIHNNDVNTPVTFGTIYVDANGGAGAGFSVDNTRDLIDILSPHQYVGGIFGNQTIDDNVSTLAACYNNYDKPVFLEEGAIPQGGTYINAFVTSPRTVANYILRSKKYLAGALNNYQAKGVWVTDPFNSNYQVTFDLLKPFMNDALSNDFGTDPSDGSTFGQSTPFLSLSSTNIPKRKGRRYLVPSIDKNRIQSSAKAISGSSDCLPRGTYKYIVTAVVSGKELPAYPSAQCSVNISSDNKYYAEIDWSLPLDEYSIAQIDSYRIYRYSDSNNQYLLVGISPAYLDNTYIDNYYSNSSSGYYHGFLFSDLAKTMTTNTTRIYIKDNQNSFFLDSGGCRIGTQDLAYNAKTYESSSNTWYLTISNHTGSDNSHSLGTNVYPTFSQFTDNKGLIDFSPNAYTYSGFVPIPIDPLAPSNFYGVDIDASYIAQTHLTKSISTTSPTFSQMSSIYYNGTKPLGSKIILNLNSINVSANQTINTLKTVTNLKVTKSSSSSGGNTDPTGTEIMQVKLFRSQDVINNQDQSGARILVNNNSTPTANQWFNSGQHTWSIPIATGTSSFPINWGTSGYDSNGQLFINFLDVYDLSSEPQQGQYVSGPGIALGSTIFFSAYVNTQDNGLYHYQILLSNSTTSDQSAANVTLTFTDGDPRAALDGLELHFLPDDGTNYSPGNDPNNLSLYTSYVEVKLTETLSRVGTPVATIV
jgi:hypothetical protein